MGDPAVTPPPCVPADVIADSVELAGGVVVFDLWVGNNDRHPGNLVYQPGGGQPTVIDHSHALMVGPNRAGLIDLDAKKDNSITGQCLAPLLASAAPVEQWFDVLFHLTPTIHGAVLRQLEFDGNLNHEEVASIGKFLEYRRTNIFPLAKALLPHITDWSAP